MVRLMKTLVFVLVMLNSAFGAGIRGSKHDFSNEKWSEGEYCKACHIPHGANVGSVYAPLWSHTITTQTFTPYTSNTMKATPGQPDGLSKLCLSCHDGTIAIDSFNGVVGTDYIKNAIGPDLKNGDGHWGHPISIVYDSNLAIANTRLHDPTVQTTALGSTIQRDLLYADKVQCTSCHDVHDKRGISSLLRISENTLCLTCHRTKP